MSTVRRRVPGLNLGKIIDDDDDDERLDRSNAEKSCPERTREKSVPLQLALELDMFKLKNTLPPAARLPPPPPPGSVSMSPRYPRSPRSARSVRSPMTIRKEFRVMGNTTNRVKARKEERQDEIENIKESELERRNKALLASLEQGKRLQQELREKTYRSPSQIDKDISKEMSDRIATAREKRPVQQIDKGTSIKPTAIKLTTSTKSPKLKSGFLSRLGRLASDIKKRFYPKTKRGGRSRQRKGRKTQKRRRRKTQKRRKNYNNYF